MGCDMVKAAGDLEAWWTWHGHDGRATRAPRTARRRFFHRVGAGSRGVRPQGYSFGWSCSDRPVTT
jgi:hypothetical protein